MNKIREMVKTWQPSPIDVENDVLISIPLKPYDVARVQALAEIFREHDQQQIIRDLLSAALDEAEESLPYIQGAKVISSDEFGDPIYEDIGLTPHFLALVKQFQTAIESEQAKAPLHPVGKEPH